MRGARPLTALRPLAAGARAGVACALLFVAACGANRDFETAERANTPAAWEEYLRQHPNGGNSHEARERLVARVDDREWSRADAAHTQSAYEAYLRAYPQGIHSQAALLAIGNLNLVVPPPKPAAVAQVEAVAPSEPVLRKPTAGAIERAALAPAAASPDKHAGAASPKTSASVAPVSVGKDHPARAVVLKSPVEPARQASDRPAPTPAAAPLSAEAAVVPKPRAASARAAHAAPAAPPAEVPMAEIGGYRVQLGAFFTHGSATAERVWHALQGRYPVLGHRSPIIAGARSADGRSIYRLQVAGLKREAANAVCSSLAERHDPCIVIAPQQGHRR